MEEEPPVDTDGFKFTAGGLVPGEKRTGSTGALLSNAWWYRVCRKHVGAAREGVSQGRSQFQ